MKLLAIPQSRRRFAAALVPRSRRRFAAALVPQSRRRFAAALVPRSPRRFAAALVPQSRRRFAAALCTVIGFTVLLTAPGCLATVEPDVGALRAGTCKPEDSDPAHDVSFTDDLLPLFQRPNGMAGCACHQPGNRRTSGIDATGLSLLDYKSLMRGGSASQDTNVVPGNPCMSLIVQKVSEAPPAGSRMPSDGPPYLSPPEIALLSDWIAEGAHDN